MCWGLTAVVLILDAIVFIASLIFDYGIPVPGVHPKGAHPLFNAMSCLHFGWYATLAAAPLDALRNQSPK